MWGYPVRSFPKPGAVSYTHSLLSQAKAEAFTTQLTNESKANLVSFVSHFQTLIKIICSDCLGKLFFALPFPSLYQYNFTGSRFPRGGSWQPWRGMREERRLTHTFAGSTARPLGSQQGGNPRPSTVRWTGSLSSWYRRNLPPWEELWRGWRQEDFLVWGSINERFPHPREEMKKSKLEFRTVSLSGAHARKIFLSPRLQK